MTTTTTIKAGDLPQTISLPEGQALTLSGSAGAAGVAYLLDQALGGSNSIKSWSIGAGVLPTIGPFIGAQQFLISCSAGNVVANMGDAVLSLPRTPLVNSLRRWLHLGDSRVWGGQPYRAPGLFDGRPYYPSSFSSGGANVASGSWVVNLLIDGKAPASSSGSLETDGAGRLRWTFTGDALPGPWVDMTKGGWAYLNSGSSSYGLHVSVRGGTKPPATPGIATVSAGVTIPQLGEYNPLGFLAWFAGCMGDTFSSYDSYAISGATSTDVLKFAEQALAVGYEAGGLMINVNDFASVTTVAQGQAAAILAVNNNKAIIDKMCASLRYVYVSEDFPWPGGNAVASKYQALASQLIRDYCCTLPNVRFVSSADKMVDPNGNTFAGRTGVYYSADNIHLQPYGANIAASPLVAAVRQDYPTTALRRSNYTTYDSLLGIGWWNSNPGLRGSGGSGSGSNGVTGPVPDGYSLTRSGTAQTCSTRFAPDVPTDGTAPGPDWYCLAVLGAAVNDYHQLSIPVTVPADLVGTNTPFRLVVEYKLFTTTNTGINIFSVQANGNGNIQSDYLVQITDQRGFANFTSEGPVQRLRSEPQLLLPGTNSFSLRVRVGANGVGSGGGEIGFRIVGIEKATSS